MLVCFYPFKLWNLDVKSLRKGYIVWSVVTKTKADVKALKTFQNKR